MYNHRSIILLIKQRFSSAIQSTMEGCFLNGRVSTLYNTVGQVGYFGMLLIDDRNFLNTPDFYILIQFFLNEINLVIKRRWDGLARRFKFVSKSSIWIEAPHSPCSVTQSDVIESVVAAFRGLATQSVAPMKLKFSEVEINRKRKLNQVFLILIELNSRKERVFGFENGCLFEKEGEKDAPARPLQTKTDQLLHWQDPLERRHLSLGLSSGKTIPL